MSIRLSVLSLLLLCPLANAQAQQDPAAAAEPSTGFDGPLPADAEDGFAIGAMVANLKLCGGNEQQLTAFYNREKLRGQAQAGTRPDYGRQFDAGFVQGRNHMAVIHQRGHALPDARICQGLWHRYNQR